MSDYIGAMILEMMNRLLTLSDGEFEAQSSKVLLNDVLKRNSNLLRIQQLEEQLRSKEGIEDKLEEAKQNFELLKQKEQSFVKEIEGVKEKIEITQAAKLKKIDKLDRMKKKYKGKTDYFKRIIQKKNNKLINSQRAQKEHLERKQKSQEKIALLKEQYEPKRAELQEIVAAKQAQVKALKQAEDMVITQQWAIEKEIKKAQKKLKEKQKNLVKLKIRAEESKKGLEEFKKQIQQQKEFLLKSFRTCDKHKQTAIAARKRNEKLKAELDEIIIKYDELKTEVKKMNEEERKQKESGAVENK